MPLRDLVIDTNVFMHAGDPQVPLFQGALNFLTAFEQSATPLCIDKPDLESPDSYDASLIFQEYMRKMRAPTYGKALLTSLLQRGRVVWISRDVGAGLNKRIIRMIPNNKRDRTFVRVALGSHEKVFITNDAQDFTARVRREFFTSFEIRIFASDVLFADL